MNLYPLLEVSQLNYWVDVFLQEKQKWSTEAGHSEGTAKKKK